MLSEVEISSSFKNDRIVRYSFFLKTNERHINLEGRKAVKNEGE